MFKHVWKNNFDRDRQLWRYQYLGNELLRDSRILKEDSDMRSLKKTPTQAFSCEFLQTF